MTTGETAGLMTTGGEQGAGVERTTGEAGAGQTTNGAQGTGVGWTTIGACAGRTTDEGTGVDRTTGGAESTIQKLVLLSCHESSCPRIPEKPEITKTIFRGQILVDGAAVLEAAVEANNGRLYLLDGVLTPPSIKPVLPHRCDITETKIIQGECVSCSKVKLSQCTSGVHTGLSIFGCHYTLSIGPSAVRIPATGCRPRCNATVTTPACCKGFYGPDCSPCPGGYQTPCSGHGQCLEGLGGNGSCVCDSNFSGSRCQYCSSSNKCGPNCDRTCPCIHGQCDNRPDSDGRCKLDSCLTGFTGRFCDRRTTACGVQVQFCHAHSDCVFSQGTTR
ncbi:stabilin-2-like [Micropterus dolomieu]|uniref:stabilin-2-like n=1 Tax=Micropterus dolomieu TaxID=147949 RepID=UPI001E8CCABC|nr:stabilin-2-like [Micropterus dolomieu]